MAKAFTTKAVEAFRPDPDKRLERADPAMGGLYLVIQPSGSKSWAYRYSFAGKPKKLTLGRWPVMGVADARRAATEAREVLDHGNDPSAKKKAAKAQALEAQLAERDTVAKLVEQYAKRHLSTLKSGDHAKQFLDRFVIPAWGDRNVHDVTRRDVVDLLDGIVDSGRGMTANAVRAYTRAFFNWCVERDVLAVAPTMGVKPPVKPTRGDRVLSDDEIRWFWRACDEMGQPWGPIGKLLILTGQRRGEVVGMTTGEIKGDTWYLPAERTKNARAHVVPLSEAASAVVAAVQRVPGPRGYLHTTTGEAPLRGLDKGRERIAERMARIAAEERGEPVDIPRWTLHDLRRTTATRMGQLGVSPIVIESVLNHVSGLKAGVAGVYNHYDYADEKRQALEAWARFVMELVEGKADNVVRMAKTAARQSPSG
jgi:integrase